MGRLATSKETRAATYVLPRDHHQSASMRRWRPRQTPVASDANQSLRLSDYLGDVPAMRHPRPSRPRQRCSLSRDGKPRWTGRSRTLELASDYRAGDPTFTGCHSTGAPPDRRGRTPLVLADEKEIVPKADANSALATYCEAMSARDDCCSSSI